MPSLKHVTVLIPALNEERSLPLVMQDLPEVGRVILVDGFNVLHAFGYLHRRLSG